MSPLLQLHPRRRWRSSASRALALLALPWLAAWGAAGCGEVTCPEGMSNVGGICQKVDPMMIGEPDAGLPDAGVPDAAVSKAERCDGVDNDGDEAIDEEWPELGEPCGEGGNRGECHLGEYACAADGLGVVCEGAVEPVPEVCDGKDNDCDDVTDEGVLSVKQERFPDHATVVGVDGGFVVARMVVEMLRIETYGIDGERTGHHDDVPSPSGDTPFLESAAAGQRVLVALGRHQFHVVEAAVDSVLVPVITNQQQLHDDWDQGIDWGIYNPPFHPRVSAMPPRFVGHRDLVTFALSPFSSGGLRGLASPPIEARGLPYHAHFDAAGAFAVWEQNDNIRAGWLLDDGLLLLDIDVDRGRGPAIALGEGGPGIAYVQDGQVLLSELGGATLQCRSGGHCGARIEADAIGEASAALALGFDEVGDTWTIAAREQILVVGRGEAGPVVKQRLDSSVGDEPPVRADVATSGGTAAVVQAGERGESVLTFMGCF